MSMFRGLSIEPAGRRAQSEEELLAKLEAEAGAAGAAAAKKIMAEETHISRARSWRDLVAVVANGVDHGAFAGWSKWQETMNTASGETRRWLRLIRLITELRATAETDEILRWLDTPHPDLRGNSPFVATVNDFPEVHALVRLTGGRPLVPGSIEASLFADLKQMPQKIGAALEGDNSLLSDVVRLLLAHGRSLHEAGFELTCVTVDGGDRTLYRLASAPAPDIEAIKRALREACGIEAASLRAPSGADLPHSERQ